MATIQLSQSGLGTAMLPFVMRELADMVMKKKRLPMEDALHYIYTSKLYQSLLDEDTKLWYSSTLLLYESLEKEKIRQKKTDGNDSRILSFKVFCVEYYRESRKMEAKEVLSLFSDHGVFEFLSDNFEMLHTQDADYILDTITTFIKKRK